MEQTHHTLDELFLQLGLPHEKPDIEQFIKLHRPLSRSVVLSEAPFWNKAQRDLLSQSIKDDADWAEVVDQLDTRLR